MNNDEILAEINNNNFELNWYSLEISPDQTVQVTGDALKINGIRIMCSYNLNKAIATIFGAELLTEQIANLIHSKATIKIDPVVKPISSDWSVCVAASQDIDKLIKDKYGDVDLSKELVSNRGKYWIQITKPPFFANLGFYVNTPMWKGIKAYPTNIMGQYVIQPLSTCHNSEHFDYSQTCSFFKK